ncbi:uncharacterized protein LOC133389317 isoform X2 [Rhineura floridana]|uniref:uncharacterized protein LOC133389317 isoform X2 n=1 Tax=Rhineura floridana TaxID=261503 RepID=UPI002AC82104|nr:uncharacterized protein LOC133389317 isoform X2 [Rhineura floridana]
MRRTSIPLRSYTVCVAFCVLLKWPDSTESKSRGLFLFLSTQTCKHIFLSEGPEKSGYKLQHKDLLGNFQKRIRVKYHIRRDCNLLRLLLRYDYTGYFWRGTSQKYHQLLLHSALNSSSRKLDLICILCRYADTGWLPKTYTSFLTLHGSFTVSALQRMSPCYGFNCQLCNLAK